MYSALRTAFVIAIFWGSSATASADSGPSGSMDLRFFSKNSVSLFSPTFNLQFPVGDRYRFTAEWGVFFIDPANVERSEFKSLNPFVAGYYRLGLADTELAIGLGFAAPVLNNANDLTAAGVALAMRGGYNAWLYRPNTWTVAIPAHVDLGLPGIDIKADAAAFVTIATDAGDTEFNLQLGAEASFPVMLFLDLGARLQLVTLAFDNTLVSIEPFVGLSLGPVDTRLGFVINLDAPNSFADNGVWGVHASVGLSF